MLDIEHHWFYGTRRPSAYAVAEQIRREFWWRKLCQTHIACARPDLPYAFHGYWHGHRFELEFEPRKSLILRADADLPAIIETLTRSLRRRPDFRYQDGDGRYVFEWWLEGGEERWQAIQGLPMFRHLQRLSNKTRPFL